MVAPPRTDSGTERVVAYSNRLPVRRVAGGWRPSAGGLVAAVRPALGSSEAVWIGWDPSGAVPARVPGLGARLEGLTLTRSEVDAFYHGFSNRTLWPLLHGAIEDPVFEPRWWQTYVAVNRRFAAARPPGESFHWVHDYQLFLLPQALRDQGGEGRIRLFLHVPFPAPELFARLPWRRQILEGMLGADTIGFHTTDYRDNFLRACARHVRGIDVDPGRIRAVDGRVVHADVNPISVDAPEIAADAVSSKVDRFTTRLLNGLDGRRMILGVDRLDYTKGIAERLRAIELLFALRPERRREVVFIQLAVPSRGEIREYEALRSTVERLVGRINGRFTEAGGPVPVHYLHRSVAWHQLLAYYRVADVCLVTPLADGMNLVAKEFAVAAAAAGSSGALVLSEFAGASRELREALPCNPYDLDGLAGTIDLALELPPEDRRRRLARLAATVAAHDVQAWYARESANPEV